MPSRPRSFASFFRPPGRVYYALLLAGLIPPIICCWSVPPFPPAVLRAMIWCYDLFWLTMAVYGVVAAGRAWRTLFYPQSLLPRVRWIMPPLIFLFAHFIMGARAWFNVAFPLSRPKLDAFVTSRPATGGRVGEFDITRVEYLPNGEAKLYVQVGYNWFDAQGLLYSPAPPSGSASAYLEHVSGPWYRFCDG